MAPFNADGDQSIAEFVREEFACQVGDEPTISETKRSVRHIRRGNGLSRRWTRREPG